MWQIRSSSMMWKRVAWLLVFQGGGVTCDTKNKVTCDTTRTTKKKVTCDTKASSAMSWRERMGGWAGTITNQTTTPMYLCYCFFWFQYNDWHVPRSPHPGGSELCPWALTKASKRSKIQNPPVLSPGYAADLKVSRSHENAPYGRATTFIYSMAYPFWSTSITIPERTRSSLVFRPILRFQQSTSNVTLYLVTAKKGSWFWYVLTLLCLWMFLICHACTNIKYPGSLHVFPGLPFASPCPLVTWLQNAVVGHTPCI